MDKYNNLDAVRLILAMTVVLGHGLTHWYGTDFRYGVAVSLFLGISGYLVLGSRENSASAAHFLWKRFLRIYPLMVVAILIATLGLNHSFKDVVVFLLSAGIKGDAVLGPAWTIVVEEVMYVLLLILFAAGFYRRPWTIAILMAATVAGCCYVYFDQPFKVERIIILPANFFFGNLLYIYRDKLARFYRLWTIPCFVLGFGFMWTSIPWPWPGPEHRAAAMAFHLTMQFFGIVACIGLGFHTKPVFGWLRSKVGDLSYSVYILHSLLLAVIFQLEVPRNDLTFAAFVLGTIVSGWISWQTIESRALSYKNFRRERLEDLRVGDVLRPKLPL